MESVPSMLAILSGRCGCRTGKKALGQEPLRRRSDWLSRRRKRMAQKTGGGTPGGIAKKGGDDGAQGGRGGGGKGGSGSGGSSKSRGSTGNK